MGVKLTKKWSLLPLQIILSAELTKNWSPLWWGTQIRMFTFNTCKRWSLHINLDCFKVIFHVCFIFYFSVWHAVKIEQLTDLGCCKESYIVISFFRKPSKSQYTVTSVYSTTCVQPHVLTATHVYSNTCVQPDLCVQPHVWTATCV